MAKSASPVYALVGDDSFLQLQELAAIARLMPKDVQRADYDGETAQLADVLDELRSYSMFGGGGKLVVARNGDELLKRFREQMEDYVAEPADSGTLVLRLSSLPKNQRIYKLIEKHGQIVPCDPPGEVGLVKWAIERAKSAHRVTLAPDAAKLLVEQIGRDLGRLDSEIAKLAIGADEDAGGKITADAVRATVAFTREREMWDLTNAMAVGNTAEALRRWRQLLESNPATEYMAFGTMAKWTEDLAIVIHQGPDAAKRLVWKYKDQFPKFLASAKAIGPGGLARMLDLLTEIDKQSKSGVGDAAGNVERFILALSPAAAH